MFPLKKTSKNPRTFFFFRTFARFFNTGVGSTIRLTLFKNSGVMLLSYLIAQLIRRLRSINFKRELQRLWADIAQFARKLGFVATRELLTLYYALSEGDLTPKERAFTYAAIAYVLIPNDLLSRKVFGLLGITDDATALVYAFRKIQKSITPEIRLKAVMKAEEWFASQNTSRPESIHSNQPEK